MPLNLIILIEFIKVGFFAIGGGLATLPFFYHIGHIHDWYSAKELSQMLAVASIVPGPIGINLATFSGFVINGVLGAFFAIIGIMVPSLIVVILISKILKNFRENIFVKSLIYILKPTGCAMISAVGFKLLKDAVFKSFIPLHISIDYAALILLIILMIISFKNKRSPLFYLSISAIAGIIVYFLNGNFKL